MIFCNADAHKAATTIVPRFLKTTTSTHPRGPSFPCPRQERAHTLSVKLCALGLSPIDGVPPSPVLRTRVWGRCFEHPLGLAAGYDKQAEARGTPRGRARPPEALTYTMSCFDLY